MTEAKIVPALRYRFLTQVYDALIGATMPEGKIRRSIVELSGVRDCCRVLDVGCGTGTLALLIKSLRPGARVTALDADEEILQLARRKAAGQEIDFRHGYADKLPFEDGTFDIVVSSLVFHHLKPATKKAAFREIRRVLRPAGVFLLADWGKPSSAIERLQFYSVQFLDGFETTSDNVKGKLPVLARGAGFDDFKQIAKERTLYGVLSYYRGRRPE